MSYTRIELENLLKLGIAVIVCGKVIDKLENLPSQEEIDKCTNVLNIHSNDTFFGLPAKGLPKNNTTIVWNDSDKNWVFTTMEEILNITNCQDAATQLTSATDKNTDLSTRVCNLLQNQKGNLDNLNQVILNLQSQLTEKDQTISALNVELNKYKAAGDCNPEVIAILENSIRRLGANNLKMEECIAIIEQRAVIIT